MSLMLRKQLNLMISDKAFYFFSINRFHWRILYSNSNQMKIQYLVAMYLAVTVSAVGFGYGSGMDGHVIWRAPPGGNFYKFAPYALGVYAALKSQATNSTSTQVLSSNKSASIAAVASNTTATINTDPVAVTQNSVEALYLENQSDSPAEIELILPANETKVFTIAARQTFNSRDKVKAKSLLGARIACKQLETFIEFRPLTLVDTRKLLINPTGAVQDFVPLT